MTLACMRARITMLEAELVTLREQAHLKVLRDALEEIVPTAVVVPQRAGSVLRLVAHGSRLLALPRPCWKCGIVFTPTVRNQYKYCSVACRLDRRVGFSYVSHTA